LLAVVGNDGCIEGKLIRLIVVIRCNNADFAIIALSAANDRLVINGARQNETIVIVGMFTNQVYAARRLNDMGGRVAKFLSKQ